ncbi:GumC family protein [Thiocapsa marina]|uniref:Lipopolysaccharide biosynthesis protein n=1 Tax=Thiocapsa marina 5811 TaxID=768671 RepID=F9UDN8_9GAMM|nr:Wzz/FepE/Etk N-terminal domain-containing protein [Thiocapsa marina]EGV17685.1 lipopolysaccharide biosynthesis protein [Thiocapsa marina 5811]
MSAPPTQPVSSGAFQPLNSIWNHKLLIVLVALVVATGGTYVAYIKGTAVYRATAVIYVAPRFANILEDSKELEFQSFSQFQQFMKQQARTINRYDIVSEALARLGERGAAVWRRPDESEREATERLQQQLQVRDVRDTYLITVSLDSENADGLDEIVNSVVTVYLEKSKKEEIYAGEDRIEILSERRKAHVLRIQALTEQRNALAQVLGVTTFVEGSLNPYDTLLIESTSAVLKAERARIEADAELATYDAATGGESARLALNAAASEIAAKDPGLNSLKANLYKRRSEVLEQTTGLTENHPVRRIAQRELDDLENEVQSASAQLIAEKSVMLLEERRGLVRERSAVEDVLRAQLREQQNQAAWFSTRYNDALDATNEIARERKALDAIDDRIEFLEIEASAPGFIRVSTWAMPAILPVSGGRTKLAVVFAALGGILGLVAAIAVDLFDRRVQTSRQVQSLVGFPPLGSFLEPSRDPAHRALLADQMRRLALALKREHDANGVRRLLVTAARDGCGSTTIVLDLARELTRQGLRTLVIEANLFFTDPRYRATPDRPSLLDILSDDLDPTLAIVPGDENLPDRIRTGDSVNEQMSNCSHLPRVLDRLDAQYDMVFIDAAPIRLSADTEYLAGICDATWLVVRARLAQIGEVKGSAARLEKAAPPAVGLIMTGLTVFLGGGYYGKVLKEYRKTIAAKSR